MTINANWFQAGVAGLTAAVGTVFWAGMNNQSLHMVQAQVQATQAAQAADHDRLIADGQKLDDISTDVKDIKHILQKQGPH